LERIAAHDMAERVIISSFDPASVRAVTERSSGVLGGLLVQRPSPDLVALARGVGASLVHVEHGSIDRDLVEMAHADGLGVLAWTVNRPEEMRRLAALGVDAILSDDPLVLRETIGASAPDAEGI
jgi:glycerophosphoryl diester phosphodiesterase